MPDPHLELDAVLRCPHCREIPFKVYRIQNQNPDGRLLETYRHVLWPTNAAIVPPLKVERILCPDCRDELRREAP